MNLFNHNVLKVKLLSFSLLVMLGVDVFAQEVFCPPFSGTIQGDFCPIIEPCDDCWSSPYRSITGHCNNLLDPNLGAMGSLFPRQAGAAYLVDGNEMIERGNPRLISNAICNQVESTPDERGVSAFMYSWLQFIDHDLDVVALSEEKFHIDIPIGDPYFDPFFTGTQSFEFERSDFEIEGGVRQHANEITSWLDASNVYGSSIERATWLRTHQRGKLKVSNSAFGDMLPWNTIDGQKSSALDPTAPRMDGDRNNLGVAIKTYVAGDIRAAEQPTLTSMHTLFVREHNRFCDQLIEQFGITDDEYLYQIARAYVSGLLQSITLNEALPALGIDGFDAYQYDPFIDPRITHEFATAAYRFGHTMLPSEIVIIDENCEAASFDLGTSTVTGEIGLRDAFFNVNVLNNNGFEAILRGISTQTQQRIDEQIVDDVRNFLFGPPGAGGLDLAVLNIQRGRDHGLADFNTIRAAFGLERYAGFDELTDDIALQNQLASVYASIDNVDAWVGMICEKHLPSASIGETIHAILFQQFSNLKNGDRFWYENNHLLLPSEINEITHTTLADVIARNTNISNLRDVFFAKPCEVEPTYCEGRATDASYEWIEKVKFHMPNGAAHYQSGNNEGYADFSHHTFDMLEQPYALFKIFVGKQYQGGRLNFKVWVDYDKNGDFNGEKELVFKRYYKKKHCFGHFYFPEDIEPGAYRMRIGMSYGNTNFGPCETYQYGEMEDYTIFIDPDNELIRSGGLPDLSIEDDEDLVIEDMTIFPNPTTELINIMIKSEKDDDTAVLQLVGTTGQIIKEQGFPLRAGENVVEFTIPSSVRDGQYFLKVSRKGLRPLTRRVAVIRA